MNWFGRLIDKFLPSQDLIKNSDPGGNRTTSEPYTLSNAYREIAIVNRVVNMWVDAAAEVSYDVKKKLKFTPYATIDSNNLNILLNHRPNPYMDTSLFRRLILLDLLMEGQAFIYWDSHSLFHVPAANMEVVLDTKKYINKFVYNGRDEYKPNQIIYIKDNAYYGQSVTASGFAKMGAVLEDIKRLKKLAEFKEKFYDNGAVIGLVIETDQLLSKRHKQRYEEETAVRYNPKTGKTNVLVLDGGFKAKNVTNNGFKELGTTEDQINLKNNICSTIGVPPILIDGGNNANISPNINLMYSMSIMPNLRKIESALELFFGYDIALLTDGIMALAPDRKALADYVSSLKNNGIISGNEARSEIRYEVSTDPSMDKIIHPANVAGSATGISGQEGGAPPSKDTGGNK